MRAGAETVHMIVPLKRKEGWQKSASPLFNALRAEFTKY